MYKRVYPGPYGSYRPFKRFKKFTAKAPTAQYAVQNKVYPRGPTKVGSLATQVKSLQRFVDKMKPEKKYFETALTLTDVTDANGGIVELTAMAAGDTGETRTGNAINVTDVRCCVTFPRAATISTTYNPFVRWAIVVDTQQVEDTDAVVTDIFSGADPVAVPALANLNRFKVLYLSPMRSGIMMGLYSAAASTPVPQTINYMEYTWTGNLRVQYNGSGAGDIQKNGIYFVVLVDGLANTLDVEGVARMGFTDA